MSVMINRKRLNSVDKGEEVIVKPENYQLIRDLIAMSIRAKVFQFSKESEIQKLIRT